MVAVKKQSGGEREEVKRKIYLLQMMYTGDICNTEWSVYYKTGFI